MKLWIDAQLSPGLADWLNRNYDVTAIPVRALGLQNASDREIFDTAREAQATVITKDRDFTELLERLGPPPQVVWITCGNTSNARMRQLFTDTFPDALRILRQGEPLVEIAGGKT